MTRDEIVDLIGEEGLQRLVAWRGGRTITVPSREADIAKLAEVIGEREARTLAEEAPREELSVPRCVRRGRRAIPVATARVVRLRRTMKIDEIAGELRCTERTVYYHLRRAREAA